MDKAGKCKAVFLDNSVGEGAFLSGNKLTSDLEQSWESDHELTDADMRLR